MKNFLCIPKEDNVYNSQEICEVKIYKKIFCIECKCFVLILFFLFGRQNIPKTVVKREISIYIIMKEN